MLVNAPVSYLHIPDIPRIEFQKHKASFLLTVSNARYQTFSYIGHGRSTNEFENRTRTTVAVIQYYNVFPILFLYFVGIPCTVTRPVIGSSTPQFHSVNTFQARKENNRSFAHQQVPRRSKIISRDLRAVVEERGFSV